MGFTKELAERYKKELEAYIFRTPECDVEVKVELDNEEEEVYSIEVIPAVTNYTGTLYYMAEIVDFCRGRKLNSWADAIRNEGHPYVRVHIY